MRGIDRIVMDRDPGVPAARGASLLAQRRPLPDIQVERGGQHEDERGLVADSPIDHPAEVVLTRVVRRSGRQAGEIDPGRHSECALRERLRRPPPGLRALRQAGVPPVEGRSRG